MSSWRKIRRSLLWSAIAATLGITHYLVWSVGRDEAEIEHIVRTFPTGLERTIEQIKADEADEPSYRRRVEAELRDELATYGRAVEAAGCPPISTMSSDQVADQVRRSKELIPELKK